jgi:hypothetical protein
MPPARRRPCRRHDGGTRFVAVVAALPLLRQRVWAARQCCKTGVGHRPPRIEACYQGFVGFPAGARPRNKAGIGGAAWEVTLEPAPIAAAECLPVCHKARDRRARCFGFQSRRGPNTSPLLSCPIRRSLAGLRRLVLCAHFGPDFRHDGRSRPRSLVQINPAGRAVPSTQRGMVDSYGAAFGGPDIRRGKEILGKISMQNKGGATERAGGRRFPPPNRYSLAAARLIIGAAKKQKLKWMAYGAYPTSLPETQHSTSKRASFQVNSY